MAGGAAAGQSVARGMTCQRVLAATAGFLALVALVGWWYRETAPTIKNAGFGVGLPTFVDETAHVGIPLVTNGGSLTIGDLELVGDRRSVHVEWSISDKGFGALRGDIERRGYSLSSPDNAVVRADSETPTWLVVSMTPTIGGVYHFDGIRIDYGSGLRHRSQRLDVDICLAATIAENDLATEGAKCTTAGG
jgi:hypothetical protein